MLKPPNLRIPRRLTGKFIRIPLSEPIPEHLRHFIRFSWAARRRTWQLLVQLSPRCFGYYQVKKPIIPSDFALDSQANGIS
jgi:hypothetical protein